MIVDLKPYPAYKDSGVPWLGEVPEHWEIRRGKVLFRCIDVRSSTGQEELLTVSSERGVVPRQSASVTMFKAESYVGYKLCWPGDMVINSLWAWARGLGVSQYHGIVSSAYGVYRLQLTDEAFLGAPFPLPPPEEQSAIVRFLDHYDRKIRRYILAKQKLIKLLEEQKQAIIHRAVIRGLDPNVRLKPSGVEWLGDVPEHWKFVRLKDVAVVQTGVTLGKNYRGMETKLYPYLRVANVQHGRVDLRHIKSIDVPSSEAAGATLKAGDVLMTEGGDIDKLGRGCVWRDEIPGCLHQNHVFAVRCCQDVLLPEFLVGLMTSQHGRAYFQLTAKQTTNLASTNSTTLRAFPVIIPSVAEQRAILNDVAKKTAGLGTIIARTENEIVLLREYRTRLIADVVTGKLDVRGVIEAGNDLRSYPGLPEENGALDGFDPGEDTEAEEVVDNGEEALDE